MTYESLLLNCGGGIISDSDKSKQYEGSAALCVGIGGTGVAALSDLKGKIYQQLIPDNPGEPIPRYDGIQLLAIDADDTDYKKFKGNRRLTESEFFSIKQDNLPQLLTDSQWKSNVKKDPRMNWMEVDQILEMKDPAGAGGIRQMGRYLLVSKAASLANAIQTKCQQALRERGSTTLDVYIFAGISGGTGSGCFIDTCYLIRKVAAINGWNIKIMGYFFLPDVVTSKPEVSKADGVKRYNNSNGYAAMTELDYLMSLKEADDWFEQNYGASLMVRTQEPPVDMCHLISAQQANGKLVNNGFGYGINVASDYTMAYLADVDMGDSKDNENNGLTMRGHSANVAQGVSQLPRRYGANLSYHILGASNAEIPMNQINTYLAVGFFEKFSAAAIRPKTCVTSDVVRRFMEDNRFRARDVFDEVIHNSPQLQLNDLDRKMLAQEPCCAKGKLPHSWAQSSNNWLADCIGIRSKNVEALTKRLENYAYEKINDQSLIGRLFRKLYDMSLDPKYGPYYAAAMLDNNGQDLLAAITGEIEAAASKAEAQRIQIPHTEDWVQEANQNLINRRGNKRSYEEFYSASMELVSYLNAVPQYLDTAETLRVFLRQIRDLSEGYFKPLCYMLDNLRETFAANAAYLQTDGAKTVNAYTWQILKLDDVRERLKTAIEKLDATTLINRFVGTLLENSNTWLQGEQDKIALLIKDHMLDLFRSETSRSLQDYLFDRFPKAMDIPQLTQEVKNNIISKVDNSAIPMFWCRPDYPVTDPSTTFPSSSISVPNVCPAVCQAADDFVKNNRTNYTVRKTGISDRIFALRFLSGVPLFAYHGISLLRDDYVNACGTESGAGSHLYAYTGRGDDASGKKDWINFLPTPMPYSLVKDVPGNTMVPEGSKLVKLYDVAAELGIIGVIPPAYQTAEDIVEASLDNKNESNDENVKLGKKKRDLYAVFTTPKLELTDYTLDTFLDRGEFSKARCQQELEKLTRMLEIMHKYGENPDCKKINLKNDGEASMSKPEDVRKDYFVHYPNLHVAVREEIRKVRELKSAIEKILKIKEEYESYSADLEGFTQLLFYRMIECTNAMGDADYRKTIFVSTNYKNRYNDTISFDLCSKEMAWAKYPLYQAFRTYRYLKNPDETNPEGINMQKHAFSDIRNLRKSLDDKRMEYHKCRRVEKDYLIPAILEQVWTSGALQELTHETLRGETIEAQAEISRFYYALRNSIQAVKDESPIWPKDTDIEVLMNKLIGVQGNREAGNSGSSEPAVFGVSFAWIYYNGQQLEYHAAYSRNYALDRANNTWVPMNQQMQVYHEDKGVWLPIMLDINGNIII